MAKIFLLFLALIGFAICLPQPTARPHKGPVGPSACTIVTKPAATYSQVFVTNGPDGRATTTTSHWSFAASDVCNCSDGYAAAATVDKHGSPTSFCTAKPTPIVFEDRAVR